KVGSTLNTFRDAGDSYTLTIGVDASVMDNQYVWFRNGVAVDTTTVGEYVMNPIVISDSGVYICEVTNSAAPDLTLISNPMTVNVQAEPNSLIFTPVADVNFGTAPFVFNASASSGLPVLFEVVEGDSLVDIQGDVVTTLGIGQVIVRATQPGDDFYEAATPITRQFTINQGSQTIAFTAINDQDITLADSVELVISASSGLPIDFIIDGPAELTGSTLWLLDTGMVTVTANQAGNELYQPAFPVSQLFLVFTSDTIPPPVDSTLEHSVTVQLTSTDNASSVTASLHKASGSSFSMVQEKPLVSGSSAFSNVAGGFYSILLTPSGAAHFPTYLGGRLTLAQADIIGVDQDTILSIALIPKPDTTVQQGVAVGGSLTPEGSADGRFKESAMAGISVYLVNTSDQSIAGYGVTNGEGKFYFPNIPSGDYFFLADYEGVDLRDNQIEVNEKPLILSVEVGKLIRIVNINEGEVPVPPALITSINQLSNENIRAYPNPVVDQLTIDIPTNWLGSQAVVMNTTGQQVAYQTLNQIHNNLSTHLLPTGLYYVHIKNRGQSHFIKIVKK
ncbi:MAG: T9SS type A sorting domain-containing protein, partial [Tunicatimonas sp.]|uniref:T9SS type A sorting domain-containing protein n=1 Tax=Tunicatimonas sp. TaxID=1940096 RepID=UPI003C76503D